MEAEDNVDSWDPLEHELHENRIFICFVYCYILVPIFPEASVSSFTQERGSTKKASFSSGSQYGVKISLQKVTTAN